MTERNASPARLEAISDGVIAVIITIMVLELHAPEVATVPALLGLWPPVAAADPGRRARRLRAPDTGRIPQPPGGAGSDRGPRPHVRHPAHPAGLRSTGRLGDAQEIGPGLVAVLLEVLHERRAAGPDL